MAMSRSDAQAVVSKVWRGGTDSRLAEALTVLGIQLSRYSALRTEAEKVTQARFAGVVLTPTGGRSR